MKERKYKLLLTDLIDLLTITQIKETLFAKNGSLKATAEIDRIVIDIKNILEIQKIPLTGKLVRMITLLSQYNLQVWLIKEKMQREPENYHHLLEFAQELNGLRNNLRNKLMCKFLESTAANQRTTFLSNNETKWYYKIMEDLNES
jgi:hypothetical protein